MTQKFKEYSQNKFTKRETTFQDLELVLELFDINIFYIFCHFNTTYINVEAHGKFFFFVI